MLPLCRENLQLSMYGPCVAKWFCSVFANVLEGVAVKWHSTIAYLKISIVRIEENFKRNRSIELFTACECIEATFSEMCHLEPRYSTLGWPDQFLSSAHSTSCFTMPWSNQLTAEWTERGRVMSVHPEAWSRALITWDLQHCRQVL